jgi:hypothetical protein
VEYSVIEIEHAWWTYLMGWRKDHGQRREYAMQRLELNDETLLDGLNLS